MTNTHVQDTRASAESVERHEPMSLSDLADHIIATHHAYLRRQMPVLRELLQRAEAQEGDRRPSLRKIRELMEPMFHEIELHTTKEEMVVFPMIQQLEYASQHLGCGSYSGGLSASMRDLEHDHEQAHLALMLMRELTDGYQAPPDCGESYGRLLEALAEFDQDLLRHTFKEDHVLLPRAMGVAAKMRVCECSQKQAVGGPQIHILAQPDGPVTRPTPAP